MPVPGGLRTIGPPRLVRELRLNRPSRSPAPVAALFGFIATAALVAGCGLYSPSPTLPTPSGPAATPNTSPDQTQSPSRSPSPSPTPVPTIAVATVVLIAAIGESGDGMPSKLAWQGVQDAAGRLGADPKLVTPESMAEVTAAVAAAASDGSTIVLTVGPEASQAILAVAADHAATQFFEIDQAIPDGAPANVHGLVFDEAEAGYLAGVVAASVSASHKIGLVGNTATDVRTANYAAGFRNGATYADPSAQVTVAYATRANDTQMGRAAAAGLVKSKADIVAALPGLSGVGAMRQACDGKAGVVALDTDASLLLPDVEACLVVSVLKRYDVAARDAILSYAAGDPAPPVTMFDVAGGAISLSEFHKPVPPGLADRLAGVLAAMRDGPPRPTPAPAPTQAPTIEESPTT